MWTVKPVGLDNSLEIKHKMLQLYFLPLPHYIQAKQCNGIYDCNDRSDEDNCKQVPK
jgi:hypothetical protein